MQGYHVIHCPQCGQLMSPTEVKFSISQLVLHIFETQLDTVYSNGAMGIIDEDYIDIITDYDFLWDMTVNDIKNCYEGNVRFTLKGEKLVERFGSNAVQMLAALPDSEVNAEDAAVKELILEIKSKIEPERQLRKMIDNESCEEAILALIQYAKTGSTLFAIDLIVGIDSDDSGREIIVSDIHTPDERIVCSSKRCFQCGNELSTMAGKYEEKIVGFLGSPSAGKTAYLVSSINRLLAVASLQYDLNVTFDHESTDYAEFNTNALAPYRKGFAVRKTNKETFPQLTIAVGNPKLGKTYLYTFVDIPGETFIDQNSGSKNTVDAGQVLAERRILRYADVVLFCVSSEQVLKKFMDMKPFFAGNTTVDNMAAGDLTILGSNTVKFMNILFKNGQKRPALALVLTKADLIADALLDYSFDNMDPQRDADIKQRYFSILCPVSSAGEDMGFEMKEGDPVDAGYMVGNKQFAYERFIKNSGIVADFLLKHGDSGTTYFMDNIALAFSDSQSDKLPRYPCFAQASYGRSGVERYSLEATVRFLMKPETRLKKRQLETLKQIFGEETLEKCAAEDFQNLPKVSTAEEEYLQGLYEEYNPTHPFGIMSILLWIFAYTGLVSCVKSSVGYPGNGVQWLEMPTQGEIFEKVQRELTLRVSPSMPQTYQTAQQSAQEQKKQGGFFGKHKK